MATRIILVRHGQTKWNIEKRYQGHSDIELSEEGVRQAERVAGRLAAEDISAVYSSDLSRAFKTAEQIAFRHNLKVMLVPKLREIKFGRWEGMNFSEINTLWPGHFEKLILSPDETQIPEGETFQELKKRSYEAFEEIAGAHAGETIVIVSHGATIGAIFCSVLGIGLKHLWSIKQENTAVNIIERHQDKFIIALLNDTCHLN